MRPTRTIKRPARFDDVVETFEPKKARRSASTEQSTQNNPSNPSNTRPVRSAIRCKTDVVKCSKVKESKTRQLISNTRVKASIEKKSVNEPQIFPSINVFTQTNNVVPLNTGPKLRRSVVMESFSAFYLKKLILPGKEKRVYTDKSKCQSKGERIWTMILVHKDYPYFFRKYMSKTNLKLENQMIVMKDRVLCHNFFGFGCRLRQKTMNVLLKTNRVPLFDTLIARSFQECNMSWNIPSKTFEMTVINIPPKQSFDFHIYNPYLFELQLVVSTDSIEYPLELMSKLNSCFPNLDYVNLIYFFAEPTKKKLNSHQLEPRLANFALKLKKDQVGVREFCQTFEEAIFNKHPRIIFKVEFVYQKLTMMSAQMKTMALRRTNDAFILYTQGGNEIKATKYSYTHDRLYKFKYEYNNL